VRIAYLCSDPDVPVYGNKGASIQIRELSSALLRLGHEVSVIAAHTAGEAPLGYEVPVVALETEPLDDRLISLLEGDPNAGHTVAGDVQALLAATSLRQQALLFLRSLRPDVLYERYALFGTAGVATARELGIPLILEVNAHLSQEQEQHRELAFGATARELELAVILSAEHIVAASSILEGWVVDAGVHPDNVTVLPNGVDPSRFQPERGEREAVRSDLGLTDEPLVGFVGRLKPPHDVVTLVRAMELVRRRDPPPHLLIVGDGPDRADLEELTRSLRFSDAVTFTGEVPHDSVAAHVRAFDVAVLPYGAEGDYFSPLELFEYLAAERPVVATEVGDVGHCVVHGESGLTYAPGDARALAGAISAMLSDRLWASSLARAGRDHVRTYHTWEGNARMVAQLAEKLSGRRSAGVVDLTAGPSGKGVTSGPRSEDGPGRREAIRGPEAPEGRG
jgi:glycosyltransferase involved in cell wall biosynthesis